MLQAQNQNHLTLPELGEAKRVLIVDDSRLQRRIISALLSKWGYEVFEAESGREALSICADMPFELVLSDWMMPEMDGLEFCTAFRALPRDSYGYFILLTSKSEKGEVARGLDSGADDFLSKPVNAAELRARITAGERILQMERELTEKNRLINATLQELQTVYDSLEKDLIEARKLQQSLVPERYRDFGKAEVSLLLQPSGHVGGDLVGFYPIGKDRIGIYAIDVSGHGVSSALMTARLAGYLSASVPEQNIALKLCEDGTYQPREPAKVIEHLNRLVLDEMETEHYFTLLLADANLVTGQVVIAQAGHPHPLIQRANGQISQAGKGGLPVGLIEGADFEQFEITLAPGDRLLLLSDGVVECPNPAEELLGEEGLEQIVRKLASVRSGAFMEALMWELTSFFEDQVFPDDISGVLLEYRGVDHTEP